MKRILGILLILLWASPVGAVELQITYTNGPQDPLSLPVIMHELGDGFPLGPPSELIETWFSTTEETACFEEPDDPNIPNYFVHINNLTGVPWYELHYVADLDPLTTITNYDGTIGNPGLNDEWLAFEIDNVGINRPLVHESINANLIFEPGEVWTFILQDYTNAGNITPAPFRSIGITSLSGGDAISSGSIIASLEPYQEPVPEPATMLLLGSGLLGLAGIGRKKFLKKK